MDNRQSEHLVSRERRRRVIKRPNEGSDAVKDSVSVSTKSAIPTIFDDDKPVYSVDGFSVGIRGFEKVAGRIDEVEDDT